MVPVREPRGLHENCARNASSIRSGSKSDVGHPLGAGAIRRRVGRDFASVDRYVEAGVLEHARRRKADDAAADNGGPTLFRLECQVAGEQRGAPRERHARAAVTIVVDDGFVVAAFCAEHEAGGAVRTQSDRRARHAIERHLYRHERAHRFRQREPRRADTPAPAVAPHIARKRARFRG